LQESISVKIPERSLAESYRYYSSPKDSHPNNLFTTSHAWPIAFYVMIFF